MTICPDTFNSLKVLFILSQPPWQWLWQQLHHSLQMARRTLIFHLQASSPDVQAGILWTAVGSWSHTQNLRLLQLLKNHLFMEGTPAFSEQA